MIPMQSGSVGEAAAVLPLEEERMDDHALFLRVQEVKRGLTEDVEPVTQVTMDVAETFLNSIQQGDPSMETRREQLFNSVIDLVDRAVEGQDLEYERNMFTKFQEKSGMQAGVDQAEMFRRWKYWCYVDFLSTENTVHDNFLLGIILLSDPVNARIHMNGHLFDNAFKAVLEFIEKTRDVSGSFQICENAELQQALLELDRVFHVLMSHHLEVEEVEIGGEHVGGLQFAVPLPTVEGQGQAVPLAGMFQLFQMLANGQVEFEYELTDAEENHMKLIVVGMIEALDVGYVEGVVPAKDLIDSEPWLFYFMVSHGILKGVEQPLDEISDEGAKEIYCIEKTELVEIGREISALKHIPGAEFILHELIKRHSDTYGKMHGVLEETSVYLQVKPIFDKLGGVVSQCIKNQEMVGHFSEVFQEVIEKHGLGGGSDSDDSGAGERPLKRRRVGDDSGSTE